MHKLKIFFLIFFVFFHINSIAQFSLDNNAGFSLGINFSFGTHINKIGLFTKAYIFKDFTQINIASSYFFNFTGFEKKRKYAEFQQNIGILFSYGDSVKSKNLFLSPVSNQTSKKYSFAYSYNIYRNKIETSQQTGTIAFGIDNWQIISENDIFAVPASDKFRTASILIKYNYKNYSFGINSTLWTGNPKKAKTVKDTIFKSRFGYKDMSNSPYGKTSSGILAFETEYALPYYQSLKFSAGIDSEKIRNILQNKIIHDMYFVPKKLNKAQNPHMPMIAEDGNLYLYKKIQKIRKSKLYLKISANDMIFY